MTAQELDTMVNTMRRHGAKIDSRIDLENFPYYLKHGIQAIGRDDLAAKLEALCCEIESVNTSAIVKNGTFEQN